MEFGYRCLEIDIWDGKNGEPCVTHGNTLTQKFEFKKVIDFIS